MEINRLNKRIKELRIAKEDSSAVEAESKPLKEKVKDVEAEERELIQRRDDMLQRIGNLVHDSVPVSDDEANNATVREYGSPQPAPGKGEPKLYNHVDLVQLLDIADTVRGSSVAGSRGYYLMREGVLLNQALINCALNFAVSRGYDPVQTPFFMCKSAMAQCAQLSQFDEELYHVSGDGEDKYLIATAEQPLCAYQRDQWFDPSELPLKYAGYSTCFRKEAGSHGRDTLGIFRVHQFEKVEQFVVTSNEGDASWNALDEMLDCAEGFYRALGLPYRVVNIVSGELNLAAAKKYDLEAWFPAAQEYRELVSASNCTDYQARRLNARLRTQAGPAAEARKDHVHMLNATLSATERTLCCVLENNQTPDGVRIPKALRPYMNGLEFIPFRKQFDAKGKLVPRPKAAA